MRSPIKLTPGRLAFMRHLAHVVVARRPRGPVGWSLMAAGLTCWAERFEGRTWREPELRKHLGREEYNRRREAGEIEGVGEMLTPLGQAVLAAHDSDETSETPPA